MSRIDILQEKIDRLFDENRVAQVEEVLAKALEEGKQEQNKEFELQVLNEQIGYYRQLSRYQDLMDAIQNTLKLLQEMGLEGTIPYATSLLNIATGYRSMNLLEQALELYQIVEDIYEKQLEDMDLLKASLYNNISLLLQELYDYQGAEEALQKALEIVKYQDAGFEIAVTYTNLANTALLQKKYEETIRYASEAIKRFRERKTFDVHYSAALSAIGCCYHEQQLWKQAIPYLKEALSIIHESVGENAQYDKVKAFYEDCLCKESTSQNTSVEIQKDDISGLEICRAFYEQYGKPLIHEKYSEYEQGIAVGLVGEGSDCFGFDDEFSRDHDWGPGFVMWLSDEIYDEIGESLEKDYQNLPKEFMGFTRLNTQEGKKRCGVKSINGFYRNLVNATSKEKVNWTLVEDYSLATAVNGEVFVDETGDFSRIREDLKSGYPEEIYYKKIAEDIAKISQCGQYNYPRFLGRKDYITAELMLAECIRNVMLLAHHIENCYPPHDKWLRKSCERLENAERILKYVQDLSQLIGQASKITIDESVKTCEQVCEGIAALLYELDIISDVSSYLGAHTEELLMKASYSNMSNTELVNAIAKAEFQAFNQVKNEGGRASCQNDWPTFSIMRKSQYMTWNRTMLLQYLYDFEREFRLGHNLITEKYGRMMESTAPQKYAELEPYFPILSKEKKMIIEQIVALQMEMADAFGGEHPKTADNARSFHTYEDNFMNTSYETYLRGEISTYSDKMLQLYGRYVAEYVRTGKNIMFDTVSNTAKLYGYADLDAFEKAIP